MTERDDQVRQNVAPDRNLSPEADEAEPRRVRVPTSRDLYGRPVDFIDADPDAVGHWDDSRWSAHPPV
jgi:hypothetical protein